MSTVAAPAPADTTPAAPRLSLFRTLRFRLILSVALVHVVLMGAFTWEAVREQSENLRAQLYSRAQALSSLMAVASANAVLAEDLGSLVEVTDRVQRMPDVVYGEVVDARGFVLASTDGGRTGQSAGSMVAASDTLPLADGDHRLDLRDPIVVAGRPVGTVLLGVATDELDRALAEARNEGVLFILLALIIGSAAAWVLSLALTRNLHALTSAAGRIRGGDLSARVPVRSRDEAGVLSQAFNAMVASLQRTSRQVQQEHEKRTEAERLACVGELSASIAHEIRNPLSAVINSVSLLEREGLPTAERSQVVSIINTESRRLQRTLNDFLDFARIREPRLEVHDLCPLVEEVAQMVERDQRGPGGVRVHTRFPERPCRARFDADQLRQVLWNLVLNAVQAMPEGGEIRIRVARRDGRLEVSITDNGPGIADAFLAKATKPFVTGRKQGTGLGLPIAQRILMQHGAELNIASQVGVGTEVSFELHAG